jgi:hypothetical protein
LRFSVVQLVYRKVATVLQELNKESLLLLYQADELSASDRAKVERMLASDAGLRADLEKLNGALESFEAAMPVLDARPVPSESAMTRRIGIAMRQRMAERLSETARSAPAERGLRYPAWVYPLATAAAVLIVFLGYWGHQPDDTAKIPPRNREMVKIPSIPGNSSSTASANSEDPQVAEVQAAEMSDNFENGNSTQPEKSVVSLDVAEHHLAELARSRDQLVPSVLGFNDGNE